MSAACCKKTDCCKGMVLQQSFANVIEGSNAMIVYVGSYLLFLQQHRLHNPFGIFDQ